MPSSVGTTALLAIAGGLSPTGVGTASALSIAGGVAVSGTGTTIALLITGSQSVSSVGDTYPIAITASTALPDSSVTTVALSTTWSFQEDPNNIGVTNGWFEPGFNIGAWGTIQSGATWESQIGPYSGYGWYIQQNLNVNIPLFDQWLVLSMGAANGNVDVWWNGALLPGSHSGNYQYKNVFADINYYLPPSTVLSYNTLAVRCWGGNLDTLSRSGLVETQSLTAASTSLMYAKPGGGTIAQEVPLGAYDFSGLQQGVTTDIVLKLQNSQVTGLSNPYITYSFTNIYDKTLTTAGLQAITLGSDSVYRAIIELSGQTATNVYLSGNIYIQWLVLNYVPGPMTDTGQQIVINTGGGSSYTLEIWSQTWAAGTVTLPPDGSSASHGVYLPIIPAGVALSNLVVYDNLSVGGIPDSSYWAFETNLQVGSLINGDRTYTIQSLPGILAGAQFIQTSANSKFFGGSPPITGPMATFTIGAPTTVYLGIDTRVTPSPWIPAGQIFSIDLNPPLDTSTFDMQFYGQFFTAGSTVVLPPDGNPENHGMYFVAIVDLTVVISDLIVYDTVGAPLWSVQTNLQAGQLYTLDRTYTFGTIPTYFQGAQWIQTAQGSKSYAGIPKGIGPMASFVVSKDCYVWLAADTRVPIPGGIQSSNTDLIFYSRDTTKLPALSPPVFTATPFGTLQLIDQINCATPIVSEPHPYMQGGLGGSHLQDFNTPGSTAVVSIETILGQSCREVDYGFFAYRVGAGTLVPGQSYVLALTYPEDVPRYSQLEIQAGQGYLDVGWKNGLTSNLYDPWPTSGTWRTFYQIFTLGKQTTSTGGAEAGDASAGVWIYISGKVSLPNSYWSIYTGGPAIGTISLYTIDPVANAPQINYPVGLPQRILTFDWERQISMPVADICDYATLMGYNTISPLVGMKWGTNHYGPPLAGYNTSGVDPQEWLWFSNYNHGSGIAPPPLFAGVPSYHEQFLAETAAVGLNYIPRFEYGGSLDLPVAAQAINAAGSIAVPDRYGTYSANLLNSTVTTELQTFINSFVAPFTGYSNFKGLFWRMRRDTMQISYGVNDVALFTAATGNIPPAGLNAAQLAMWASTGTIQPLYATWWHGVRATFHYSILNMIQTLRSDMIMLYYNWDSDKWAIFEPDINSAAMASKIAGQGGATAYGNDLALRVSYTASEYTTAIAQGNFSGAVATKRPDTLWPDYGLIPSLYTTPGFRLFCPVNYNAYALPDYINYFQTADGTAVSYACSYDELASREMNPKYEATEMVPGGGEFSMALEVMSWAFGNVNTLTFTSYTFARGFADYHRAFAQAFLALPDIPSSTPGGMPANITVRTYVSGPNTWIGVANTATVAQNISINVPGSWTPGVAITDLVENTTTLTATVGGALPMTLMMAPMQLSAFLAVPGTVPPPPTGVTWVPVGQCIS